MGKHRYTSADIGKFLSKIRDDRATVVTFDPQYRTVLDKLSYGNEGARQKQRIGLAQMDNDMILSALVEIQRVLKPSGYLFLWLDKFYLLENMPEIRLLHMKIVDLLTWDKQRIGMGYRTRRRCEYLLVLQKLPIRAKATWTRHDIPDVWQEKITDKIHPHSKPIELQRAIFSATLQKDDLLVDPCAGSFSSYLACKDMPVRYIGNDIRIIKNNTNMRGLKRVTFCS